ncbi:hypothetical protein FV222_04925 [Methylobacterium sp. WL103]|uniref:hypothetical protein n=1 Tax=Methylobacterium sp. WL103 TaxID=2603891 RepID=UPI0011C7721C|nr:hypothetical protein [Methylobacterium sp. WL103]TXM64766.1 hypothetical protein FV226_26075 [Methylobacterium sp. WL12]TXN06662.1 hypothetical protein FV222_04925 [Methylobacterium sp. WL103]TXN13956.1 hypothetical protein FV219_04155 [Methylobacterium sp. WL122]
MTEEPEPIASELLAFAGSLSRNLCAGKLTSEEQRRRFIEAARAAGASADEAEFDAALKWIARPKAPNEI